MKECDQCKGITCVKFNEGKIIYTKSFKLIAKDTQKINECIKLKILQEQNDK